MNNNDETIMNYGTVISLYWFSLYAYVAILAPYLMNELGLSYTVTGAILGSFGLSFIILRIPLGYCFGIMDSKKIMIVIGFVLSVISGFGFWFYSGTGLLLLLRFFAGVSAVLWLTYTDFPGYFNNRSVSKFVGIANSFTRLGQVTAIFTGGIVAALLGRRAPFLIAALAGVSGIILCVRNKERTPLKYRVFNFTELLDFANKRSSVLIIAILAAIFQFVVFSTTFGFVPVAASDMGSGDFQLGLLLTVTVLASILAAVLCGIYFVRLLGEKQTIITGFLLMAFSYAIIPFLPGIFWLYITQFFAGIGQGFVFSLLIEMSIKNISKMNKGLAATIFQMIYGIGMFAGPFVLGFISDLIGFSVSFWVAGIMGILGAVLAGTLITEDIFSYSIKEKVVEKPG